MSLVDPVGTLIAELRSDPTLSSLTTRIRGGEPAPGDVLEAPSTGTRKFQRFVVLVRLGATRQHRAPVQTVRIGVRAYGATYQDAAALYGAISAAIDNVGPRLGPTGVAIYRSLDIESGGALKDPVTGQPYEDGVLELIASTDVVAS